MRKLILCVLLLTLASCTIDNSTPTPVSPIISPVSPVSPVAARLVAPDSNAIEPKRMITGDYDFIAAGDEILTAEGQEFAVYWTLPEIDVQPLVISAPVTSTVIGQYSIDLELRPVIAGELYTKTMTIDQLALPEPGEGMAFSTVTSWTDVEPGSYELHKRLIITVFGQGMVLVDADAGTDVAIPSGYQVPGVIVSGGEIVEPDERGFVFDSLVSVPYMVYLPVIFR